MEAPAAVTQPAPVRSGKRKGTGFVSLPLSGAISPHLPTVADSVTLPFDNSTRRKVPYVKRHVLDLR
eukprot:4843717-Amphidinium_carterae.1